MILEIFSNYPASIVLYKIGFVATSLLLAFLSILIITLIFFRNQQVEGEELELGLVIRYVITLAAIFLFFSGLISITGISVIADFFCLTAYFILIFTLLIHFWPSAFSPKITCNLIYKLFINSQYKVWYVLIILLCFLFVLLPQLKLSSLHTTFYDLGLYANQLYNFNGDFWTISHRNIFFPLYSIVYRALDLNYSTHFLLLMQSVSLLFFVVLVFKFYGKAIALLCFFSYPFWYSNLFDFHFEHLALIFLLSFFVCLNRGYYKFALFSALLLMGVKEIYALTSFMCGVYMLAIPLFKQKYSPKLVARNINHKTLQFAGLVLMTISAIYLIFTLVFTAENLTNFVHSGIFQTNNESKISNLFSSYFLGFIDRSLSSPKELIISLAFVFFPLVAFCFLPLYSPLPLIICLPTIFFALFSSNPLHHSLTSHYSAILLPALCQSSYLALSEKNVDLKSWILIFPVALYLSLSPGPFSFVFLSNISWSYGYRAYISTERDRFIKKIISERFGSDKEPSLMVQNNINSSILINRRVIKPFGSFDALHNKEYSDFLILDTKRALFIDDISCKYRFGRCTDENFVDKYYLLVKKIQNDYLIVDEFDGFYIFKKEFR